MSASAAGWNDPPQFAHSSLASQGVKKSKLLKRPSPSQHHSAPPPPHTSPAPPTTVTPLPLSNARNHLLNPTSLPAPPTDANPQDTGEKDLSSPAHNPQREEVGEAGSSGEQGSGVVLGGRRERGSDGGGGKGAGECSGVVEGLRMQLEKYESSMQRREVEDVRRRLGVLERQWEEGTISLMVKTEMSRLLRALQDCNTDTAHSIHVALMVDHTAEVSQWMMGVKRLIATAKSLS